MRSGFKKYQDWNCIYQDEKKKTMTQTLILLKMRSVLKKYRDWSCIYQDKNKQYMKC